MTSYKYVDWIFGKLYNMKDWIFGEFFEWPESFELLRRAGGAAL
jgi:hypothetical protein